MHCILEFLTKDGASIASQYYHGEIKFHNGVAEFEGTPYSMGKPKKYILEEAVLLKISGHANNSMTLRGKMGGGRCQWRIRPR